VTETAAETEQQQQQQQQQQEGEAAPGASNAPAAGEGSSQRELVAVVLEFTLPPSCYATMLVRELTKSSTSKASHKQLSTRG
jgi:tRNA(Glu) U13 pseudouridine synthase TruD